jgi:hypothetical protein
MNKSIKLLVLPLLGFASLAAISLRADPVSVSEIGIGANEIVAISSTGGPAALNDVSVYAGVVKLVVNGTATNGFCIDPWHWSTANAVDQVETLGTAPKPPGPMGDATATKIEQLWAQFYTPSITNTAAAGLQIAIWELVAAGVESNGSTATFTLDSANDYGASTMISWVNANSNAATADLVALTGPGQDYVIQNMPDGGTTLCLLGLALVGLVAFRRKFSVA